MEFKSGYDITGQYNREESIQICNANILTLKVFMFPSELRELISALICDVSAPQDLWSPFPQTTPPTVSFSSCSPDFITSRPRTAQQMQTSNIQHQLHLSSCLFSLLIETVVSVATKETCPAPLLSSVWNTLVISCPTSVLCAFTVIESFPNCMTPTKAYDESRRNVTFVYSQHHSEACVSDTATEERLKTTCRYSLRTRKVFSK